MSSALDFSQFFAAVHGYAPLPWQRRLSEQLCSNGNWPDLIDLPTASGKTACIDVAVFHLAWCSSRGEPWKASRRIVFMVDRRIIVDAAFERAELIRKALVSSKDSSVVAVAQALRSLAVEQPLMCTKLRGGMPRERGIAYDPSQPMVITSTLDQIGSRLLFRGYGMSPYSWPLHAGLLGHDSLLLLDEAHLSAPFVDAVAAIRREQARAQTPLALVQPLRLVQLSATAQLQLGSQAFRLDDADFTNEFIAQRRCAPKPARLVSSEGTAAERLKLLINETKLLYAELDHPAPAVAVIVNRVRTARELFTQLQKLPEHKDIEVMLLIGRGRPIDRDRIAAQVTARAGSNRKTDSEERGLIVVATQTIEVGADLDFQGMVTECASLDALRQRFGRLDRLGQFNKAKAVIVGSSEPDSDPIYGSALTQTWQWLHSIASAQSDTRLADFSIAGMEAALQKVDIQALLPPMRDYLRLAPAHVGLLCQTSPAPMYDPDIAAMLHGFDKAEKDLQVIWRDHLPWAPSGNRQIPDESEVGLVTALLDIIPPTSLEVMSLPLRSVRAWLGAARDASDLADVEGMAVDTDAEPAKAGIARRVWRRALKSEGGEAWELVDAKRLRPGNTIIAPTVYGGCDRYGYAPDSTEAVLDLSAEARALLQRRNVVVLTADTIISLPHAQHDLPTIWNQLVTAQRTDDLDAQQLLDLLLDLMKTSAEALGWIDATAEALLGRNERLYALVVQHGVAGDNDLSDEDLSSSRTVRVLLKDHNAGVGQRARQLASRVGLNAQAEILGRAGDVHDIGKADPRFQKLLAGKSAPERSLPLAKSASRTLASKQESSERHEAYSVAALQKHPHLFDGLSDPELALYLIGTHHGRGRALMPDRIDEGTQFEFPVQEQWLSYAGTPGLGMIGSGWTPLFWNMNRRYGPWGLAYLEAVLRLADHLQSKKEIEGIASK